MPRSKQEVTEVSKDDDQNGMSLMDLLESANVASSSSKNKKNRDSICSTTSSCSSRLYSNTISRSLSSNRGGDDMQVDVPMSTFKAKPIDRRIFESQGELGIPKVESRPATEPVPFNFSTEQRASRSRVPKNNEELQMANNNNNNSSNSNRGGNAITASTISSYNLRSASAEPKVDRSSSPQSRARSTSDNTKPINNKPLTLTVPLTPKLRTAKRAQKVILSSEEIEMREIEEKKQMLLLKRQKANKKFCKIAEKSSTKIVVKSSKKLTLPASPKSRLDKKYGRPKTAAVEDPAVVAVPPAKKDFAVSGPTIPQPFHFKTDLRIKGNTEAYVSPVKSVAELAQSFMRNARSNYVPESCKKITETQPFHFKTDSRIKGNSEMVASPIKSSAELAQSFMRNARSNYVPESAKKITETQPFHFKTDLRIKGNTEAYVSPVKSDAELAQSFMRNARSNYVPESATKLTEAHSPQLRTSIRAKLIGKPLPKSHVELEEEEMNLHASGFKHKPVDKKIFESAGDLGVPKVQPKSLTVPQTFTFKTDARMRSKTSEEESAVKPKAKDAQTAEEHKPYVYVPTLPESPKFTKGKMDTAVTESRRKPHHSIVEKERKQKEQEELEKAKKFVPKTTEVKEFKLRVDSRGSAYQQELERAMARKENEELQRSTIKMKPAPVFEAASLDGFQSAVKLPLTEVKDFNLTSVKKHKLFQDDFKKHVDALMTKEKEQREIHAEPVPSTLYEPDFQYQKEIRTPLKPIEINFATESRVNKRKTFDLQNVERITEAERQAELVQMLKDAEEKEQIKDIRRKSVAEGGLMYKAAPIMKHDPYPTSMTQPRALTMPVSPILRTSKRLRASHVEGDENAINNM